MTFGDCVGTVAAASVRHDTWMSLLWGDCVGEGRRGWPGWGPCSVRPMESLFHIQVTPARQGCLRGGGPSQSFRELHQVTTGLVSFPNPAWEAARPPIRAFCLPPRKRGISWSPGEASILGLHLAQVNGNHVFPGTTGQRNRIESQGVGSNARNEK